MAEFDPDKYLAAPEGPAFDPDAYLGTTPAAPAKPASGGFQQRQHAYREAIRAGSPEEPAGAAAPVAPQPELQHTPGQIAEKFGQAAKGVAKGIPASTVGAGLVGDVEEMGRHAINRLAEGKVVEEKPFFAPTTEGGYLGPRGLGVMAPAANEDEKLGMGLGAAIGPGGAFKLGKSAVGAINRAVPPVGRPPPPPPPPGPAPGLERVNPMTGRPPVEPEVLPTAPPGSPMATPREGSLGRVMPPDVPHEPTPVGPSRAGVGADATRGPLADVSPKTMTALRDVVNEAGFTPHTVEQWIESASPHQILAEAAPNLFAELQKLAVHGGESRNLINDTLYTRAGEAKDRIATLFDRAFGERENLRTLQEARRREQSRASDPLYREFRSMQVPLTQDLQDLLPRLEAAGAFSEAKHLAGVKGVPWVEDFTTMYHQGRAPTAEAWDLAKRGLDALIEGSIKDGRATTRTRAYTALKKDLIAAIENHPDKEIGRVYREAREAFAEPASITAAEKMGRKFFSMDVDDLLELAEGYNSAERAGFMRGIRKDLANQLGNPGRTELPTMRKVLGDNTQEKLRATIGDAETDRLIGGLEHEYGMHAAPDRVLRGSDTALRETSNRYGAGPSKVEAVGEALGDIAHAVVSPKKGAAKIASKFASQRETARLDAEAQRFRNEIAPVFLLQGPERDAVLRWLATPPRAKGGRVIKRADGGRAFHFRNTFDDGGAAEPIVDDPVEAEGARESAARRLARSVTRPADPIELPPPEPGNSIPRQIIENIPKDYRRGVLEQRAGAGEMLHQGVENTKSLEPGRMALGLGQSALGHLLGVTEPVGGVMKAFTKGVGRAGPGLEHAAEVATFLNPDTTLLKAAPLIAAVPPITKAGSLNRVLETATKIPGAASVVPETATPLSSMIKRGEEIKPATGPTDEALAAARADDRMRIPSTQMAERLDTIVPQSERVAGGTYTPGAPGGGRWVDLPPETLNAPGKGFKVTDDELKSLWDQSVTESSQAARSAVAETGTSPTFTSADWDAAMRRPIHDHLWYELSGERLAENLPDLNGRQFMTLLDLVGATSARADPKANLERALAALSQWMRGKPVDIDITRDAPVRAALARGNKETSALAGNKVGPFSDTLALTGGVPTKFPISVNDVWVGKMFGVSDDVMSANQSLHEPMAKYFNKIRDLYNERHAGELPFTYQSWNFQAPAWVHLRGEETGDAYHQVWGSIVDKLKEGGVKGIEGDVVTKEALMDPKFADVLRRTTAPFRGAPKATIELNTTQTSVGKQAADLYKRAVDAGDELSQSEYLKTLTGAMWNSARGKDHAWDQLKKAVTGVQTNEGDITRIMHGTAEAPLDFAGTFEGALSPNIRIPLQDMTDEQIKHFNAIAGKSLRQDAMSTATIGLTNEAAAPAADTVRGYSLFVPTTEQITPERMRQFAVAINKEGHEMSIARYPNGYQFDVNPNFAGDVPKGIDRDVLEAAYINTLQAHYPGAEALAHNFKSVYNTASEYGAARRELIKGVENDYVKQATAAGLKAGAAREAIRKSAPPDNVTGAGKRAWLAYRSRLDRLADAEAKLQGFAKAVDQGHKSFIESATRRLDKAARSASKPASPAERPPPLAPGEPARLVAETQSPYAAAGLAEGPPQAGVAPLARQDEPHLAQWLADARRSTEEANARSEAAGTREPPHGVLPPYTPLKGETGYIVTGSNPREVEATGRGAAFKDKSTGSTAPRSSSSGDAAGFSEDPSDIVNLGERREQKQLDAFRKGLLSEVQASARERMKVGREYHDDGKLPLDVGARFTTAHSRGYGMLPWEVKGHYVDRKNPEKYGYYVERGQPGQDGWEKSIVLVNDPNRPNVAKLAEQFTPMTGPRRADGGAVDHSDAIRRAARNATNAATT